jgi:hypothetical protein
MPRPEWRDPAKERYWRRMLGRQNAIHQSVGNLPPWMNPLTNRLKRLRQIRPRPSESQILTWGDARRARTGQWPRMDSGLVRDQLGDNWRRVDTALRYGLRGLAGTPPCPLARLRS